MIRQIRIKNLRNHEDTQVPLDRINVIVGAGGSGKTTILAAIELLLTGKSTRRGEEWTDHSGKGKQDLVAHGATKAEIQGEIPGIGWISRTFSAKEHKLQVAGWTGNTTDQQKELYRQLGTDEATLRAALNTDEFMHLPPGEQTAMLFKLAGLQFTEEQTAEMILSHVASQEGVQKPTAMAAAELLKEAKHFMAGGPEVFDALDKHFREKRRQAKKTLQELETVLGDQGDEETEETLNSRLEALNSEIDAREKLHKKLQAQIAESKAQGRPTKEELEEKAEALRPEAERVAELTEQVEKKKEGLKKAKEKDQEIAQEIQEAEKQVQELEAQLEVAQSGKCPINQKECSTAGSIYEEIKRKLAKARERRTKASQKTRPQIKPLEDSLAETEKQLQAAQAAQQKLEETEKMQQAAPEKAAPPEDLEKLKTQEQESSEAIKELYKQQWDVRARLTALTERKKEQERLGKTRTQVQALEALCVACGPKGARITTVDQAFRDMQDKVAQTTSDLIDGTTAKIKLSEKGEVEIKAVRQGGATKIQQLSRSEKTRMGVAVQDALNGLHNLGTLIVDNAEQLSPGDRKKLMDKLNGSPDYRLIIIAATQGEKRVTDPGVDGIKVYTIENGTVRQAPQQQQQQEVG